MKSKRMMLLHVLLLSTSQRNKYKHTKDKKQKSKIIGTYVGLAFVYAIIMAYCILMCIGYGKLGVTEVIPTLCALTITALAFLFTIFKTNGYLFNFKEYDMLMALPFDAKTVAADKFLYMYLKSFPWYISISVAMMAGYGIYEKPNVIVYVIWLVLSAFIPVIPMLFASLAGFLIARVSIHFRHKNIIQTILIFIFVILCFCSRFIIESAAKNASQTLKQISDITEQLGSAYLPVGWFTHAITQLNLADMLLLSGVTIVLFEIVFAFVGRSYRKINSALMSHDSSKSGTVKFGKKRSVLNSIAHKEWKRFMGSPNYMINVGIGEVLSVLLGIVALVAGMDKIIAVVTKGAPLTAQMLYPAFPLIIYFLVGMVASTTCSPSLEGKNYWVIQSLPLKKKTIYQGKMLFNMYLTVPFALFALICMCISAKVPVLNFLLYIVEMIVLCAFSTTWGCVCGIKFRKPEWENELEVIKQGAGVAVYLFPNMFVTMGLVVLVVFLGTKMNTNLITMTLIVIVAILTLLCYLKVLAYAKIEDEHINA